MIRSGGTTHVSLRVLLIISCLLLVMSLLQVFWGALHANGFYDLPAYVGAAAAVWAGQSPTAQEYANGVATVNFVYPPAATLVFFPLLLVSESAVPIVFSVISLTAFVAALWLTFELLPAGERVDTWQRLLIIALLVQTFPLKLTIMLGQANTLVLFCMIASLYLFKKKRLGWSAVVLSIAITLKIWPIVFLGLALLRREWRYVGYCVGVLVVLNGLFFVQSVSFVTLTLPGLLAGSPAFNDPINQSLAALVYRLQLGAVAPFLVPIVVGCLLLGIMLAGKRAPFWQQAIALLPIMVLLPANSWQHHLILMYPFLILYCRKWSVLLPIWLVLAIRPSYIQLLWPHVSWTWSYQTIAISGLMVWFLLHQKHSASERSGSAHTTDYTVN